MEIVPNQQKFLNKLLLRSFEVFITFVFFTGGVVSYWRGVWAWQDNFLFPEDYALSLWVGGVIGIIALLISFPTRWLLNSMFKFNQRFDYLPLPNLFHKKKYRKLLSRKPTALQDEDQQNLELELIDEKIIETKKSSKKLIINEEEAPENPSASKLHVPSSMRRIKSKKFATKAKLAQQHAKTNKKKTQEQQNPVLEENNNAAAPKLTVSTSQHSSLLDLAKLKNMEKMEKKTPQGTGKTAKKKNQEASEEAELAGMNDEQNKARRSRGNTFSDEMRSEIDERMMAGDEEEETLEPRSRFQIQDQFLAETEPDSDDVEKFKIKIHQKIGKMGILSISCFKNTPLIVLILIFNSFVFVLRTVLYVSLKFYFIYLGFIASSVWRWIWGLWDVYTTDTPFYIPSLYVSMVVGVLLLLPFDALNLLSAPPCLPAMYSSTDSSGKILSMNWKGFTKGILPGK